MKYRITLTAAAIVLVLLITLGFTSVLTWVAGTTIGLTTLGATDLTIFLIAFLTGTAFLATVFDTLVADLDLV